MSRVFITPAGLPGLLGEIWREMHPAHGSKSLAPVLRWGSFHADSQTDVDTAYGLTISRFKNSGFDWSIYKVSEDVSQQV